MKRTAAIGLIALGTAGVGGYAAYESNNCQADINGVRPPACRSSYSGGSSSGSRSFFWGSGTSSSSYSSSGSTSSSTARGGFGASGAAHSSGS